MKDNIQITELDYVRLCGLVNSVKDLKTVELKNLSFLGEEIKRAERVSSEQIAPDFVTMNSQVEVIDLDTGRPMVVKLVYPKNADFKVGNVSVLSPLGAALLGYRAGSIISFEVPKGIKRMEIKHILYQPEANGEYLV